MMTKILLQILIVSFIFTGCSKNSSKEILKAKFETDLGLSIHLTLKKDNTFIIIEKETLVNPYENKYKGKYILKNDSIYFPDSIPIVKANKAVLKNNHIQFNSGVRLTITQTTLNINSKIDFSKHPDIAVFDFNPEYHYDIFDINSKPYDLEEKEILEIIEIFNSCPTKEGLLKNKKYYKQCIAIINPKGEKEVWLNCSCSKDSRFQNVIGDVKDGGTCHMNMKINLTTQQCYDVHFNGEA